MGPVLSNVIAWLLYGEAEEEERPNEQSLLISPPISHSCSDSSIDPSTHGVVIDSSIQVSPPFSGLITREPIKEDQAKEEDNEEERLIISKEVVMEEERIQQYYCSSHSIQIAEDNRQASPCTDLNTREPMEEDQAKEEYYEEEKLIMSEEMVMKERWIQHYSSSHKILLVGEGDFSFSASLAVAFDSATNMIATSLNSKGFLPTNYKSSLSNIHELRSRGCTVMHNLDATQMAKHCSLKGMTFDRIIFNFPLAGFFPDESRESEIRRNQTLILQFLENAKKMISEEGEIHIAHKSWGFFLEWNLEHLASIVGLRLVEELPFNFKDYKGYHTKYGFWGDKNFNCNPCKTYKFGLEPVKPRKIQYAWRRWS